MQISSFINNNTSAVIIISCALTVLLFVFAGFLASRIFQSFHRHEKEMEALLQQRNAIDKKTLDDAMEIQQIIARHVLRQGHERFKHVGIFPAHNSTLALIRQMIEQTANENHPHFIALNFV